MRRHSMESAEQASNEKKPKDRLVDLLDHIEIHVEQLRKDAARLEEEKDSLLTTLDTLRNNDMLFTLEELSIMGTFHLTLATFLESFHPCSPNVKQGQVMLTSVESAKWNASYISDRDDILRYADRLSMRCSTVDVLVTVQRDQVQQEALHQVNGLIDSLVVGLRQDPSSTRQRCAEFMNACSSHGMGHSDKIFETAILGCTLDDQKRVKKRLQGLLDYIDKMHILEMAQ